MYKMRSANPLGAQKLIRTALPLLVLALALLLAGPAFSWDHKNHPDDPPSEKSSGKNSNKSEKPDKRNGQSEDGTANGSAGGSADGSADGSNGDDDGSDGEESVESPDNGGDDGSDNGGPDDGSDGNQKSQPDAQNPDAQNPDAQKPDAQKPGEDLVSPNKASQVRDDNSNKSAADRENDDSFFLRAQNRQTKVEMRYARSQKELARLFVLSASDISSEFPEGGFDRALVQAANRARRAEKALNRL